VNNPTWLGVDWSWLAKINLLQVAVVVIALWVIGKLLVKFWPWLRKVMRLVDSLGGLPQYMERTDRRIEEIHHEARYNNETSMKDAVRRTELGVKSLSDRMDAAGFPSASTAPLRAIESKEHHGNNNDDQH